MRVPVRALPAHEDIPRLRRRSGQGDNRALDVVHDCVRLAVAVLNCHRVPRLRGVTAYVAYHSTRLRLSQSSLGGLIVAVDPVVVQLIHQLRREEIRDGEFFCRRQPLRSNICILLCHDIAFKVTAVYSELSSIFGLSICSFGIILVYKYLAIVATLNCAVTGRTHFEQVEISVLDSDIGSGTVEANAEPVTLCVFQVEVAAQKIEEVAVVLDYNAAGEAVLIRVEAASTLIRCADDHVFGAVRLKISLCVFCRVQPLSNALVVVSAGTATGCHHASVNAV